MAEKLGPGEYAILQLAVDSMTIEMADVEFQRVKNSQNQQLLHKYSSNDISEIESEYNTEAGYIKSEIAELDKDEQADEYKELMQELEELEDEKDTKIKQIEREMNDRDSELDTKNSDLEARYDALKADKEGLEETQESNIKGQ